MSEEMTGYIGESRLTESQVKAALLKIENASDEVSFSGDVKKWTPKMFFSCNMILNELVCMGRLIGHPKTCGLRAIGQTQYTDQLRIYATQSLSLYHDALVKVREKMHAVCELLGKPVPKTEDELKDIAKFCAIMVGSKHLPPEWVFSGQFSDICSDLGKIIGLYKKINEYKENLLKKWSESVLELNGKVLFEEWETSHGRNRIKKRRNEIAMMKKMLPYSKEAIDMNDIEECLRNLAKTEELEKELLDVSGKYPKEWFEELRGNDGEMSEFEKLIGFLNKMDSDLKSINGYEMLERINQDDVEELRVFFGTWRTFFEIQSSVYKLFCVDKSKLDECDDYIELDIKLCETWRKEIYKLKRWVDFKRLEQTACENGLEEIIKAYEEGLDHNLVIPTFEKAYYTALLSDAEEKDQ